MSKKIKIPVDEYKELLNASAALAAFENYVKSDQLGYVSREMCGKLLGFEVKDQEKDNAGD